MITISLSSWSIIIQPSHRRTDSSQGAFLNFDLSCKTYEFGANKIFEERDPNTYLKTLLVLHLDNSLLFPCRLSTDFGSSCINLLLMVFSPAIMPALLSAPCHNIFFPIGQKFKRACFSGPQSAEIYFVTAGLFEWSIRYKVYDLARGLEDPCENV
jgi:hypothetical protein